MVARALPRGRHRRAASATRRSRFAVENGEKVLVVRARRARRCASSSTSCCARSGRVANTAGYGLEELGIPLTQARTVETNEYLQTALSEHLRLRRRRRALPVHPHRLAPGVVRAVNALFGSFRKFRADYSVIPWATFTDPEVARVGPERDRGEGEGHRVRSHDLRHRRPRPRDRRRRGARHGQGADRAGQGHGSSAPPSSASTPAT